MSKSLQSASTKKGGRRGRKTILNGEDPILEERVEFIAEQLAELKTRFKIIQACREKGWELSDRQIDTYISVVRHRWKEDHDSRKLTEKKTEVINQLRRIYQRATERRVLNPISGQAFNAPDLWLMRQAIMDISKIEGLQDNIDSSDGELDTILDELAREREIKDPSQGVDGSGVPPRALLQAPPSRSSNRGNKKN